MTEEQRNERIHNILYSTDSREELAQRIVTLEDENAKMMELIGTMWNCLWDVVQCDGCIEDDYDDEGCVVRAGLRKLGIEVG